jgi:hypothetical protein
MRPVRVILNTPTGVALIENPETGDRQAYMAFMPAPFGELQVQEFSETYQTAEILEEVLSSFSSFYFNLF